MSRFRTLLCLVGLVALTAACNSSSSSKPDGSEARDISDAQLAKEVRALGADWDQAAAGEATDLAQEVSTAQQGCGELTTFPKGTYLVTFVKLGWPIPRFSGSCTLANGENLQIEVYANRQALDRRIATRAARLCPQPKFPGYTYVVADAALLTPDEQPTGEALATIVGGRATFEDCGEWRKNH